MENLFKNYITFFCMNSLKRAYMCYLSFIRLHTLSFAMAARYQILLFVLVYLLLFYLCYFSNIEYIRNKFLYS